MTALLDVDHHIIDQCYRWLRAGCDGACLNRVQMERWATLKSPSGINPAIAIGLAAPVVSAEVLDQYRRQRRSEIAAPATTAKSP